MYEKIVLRRKGGLRGISNQNKNKRKQRKQTKNKEETKAKRSDLK